MPAPQLICTITDARKAGYCPRGVKRWFDANGLDFGGFLKSGIAAADLPEDACAARVIAKAEERVRGR